MPDHFLEAMILSDRLFNKKRRRRKVAATQVVRPSTVPSPSFSLLFLALLLLLCADPPAVFSSSVPSAVNCPQWVNDEIQQCVQPVADFAKSLNNEQPQAEEEATPSDGRQKPSVEFGQSLQWPTKMGGQVFRELCRLINEFEQCVDVFRQKCRRHITISLIEASYGFLCNEGYETFMASAECLMDLDQKPNVKRCHDRTLKSIEAANNDGRGAVLAKLDKMCSALNYFSNCVRMPIRQSCGAEAWQVIFRVLKDTTRTLMPKCEFEEKNEVRGKAERRQKEETRRDEDGPEKSAETNGGKRVREKGERRQKEGEDRDEERHEGRERPNDRGGANGGDEAAEEKVANDGRRDATARQKSETNPTTTTGTFDEWERWEEEESGGEKAELRQHPQTNDEEDELLHQIHYGSAPSRNGATTAKGVPTRKAVVPWLTSLLGNLFAFLTSLFISFSTNLIFTLEFQ